MLDCRNQKFSFPKHSRCLLTFSSQSVPTAPWCLKRTKFRGAATVQLSTLTSSIVIQLARNSGKPSQACAPLLEAVFNDETIIKAGVGVDDDMLELQTKWQSLDARSRLDLGRICRLDANTGNTPGLKSLCHHLVGVHLPKSKHVACSDWSELPLTFPQLAYSARDAWAGAAVAAVLEQEFPTEFSPGALVGHLENQRTIADLGKRLKRRKQAKHWIKTIRAPYKDALLPPMKADMVRRLRRVVKENRFEHNEPFLVDVVALEFSPQIYRNETWN